MLSFWFPRCASKTLAKAASLSGHQQYFSVISHLADRSLDLIPYPGSLNAFTSTHYFPLSWVLLW